MAAETITLDFMLIFSKTMHAQFKLFFGLSRLKSTVFCLGFFLLLGLIRTMYSSLSPLFGLMHFREIWDIHHKNIFKSHLPAYSCITFTATPTLNIFFLKPQPIPHRLYFSACCDCWCDLLLLLPTAERANPLRGIQGRPPNLILLHSSSSCLFLMRNRSVLLQPPLDLPPYIMFSQPHLLQLF